MDKKKGRLLKGIGIGLIAVAIMFIIQIKPLKDEYKQIAKTNQVRAENRLNQANSYMIIGIVSAVGGFISLGFGIRKSKTS
jgi:hypothetical protein